jgi:hypothetical protein
MRTVGYDVDALGPTGLLDKPELVVAFRCPVELDPQGCHVTGGDDAEQGNDAPQLVRLRVGVAVEPETIVELLQGPRGPRWAQEGRHSPGSSGHKWS